MARKKVSIAWIAKESTRRSTFKKRTIGLMKKVRELSTLCDVKACAIVYGPHHPYPEEVWPSVADAMPVLALFKSMPEMEQCRKMINREGFLLHQLTKLQDQLRRQERDNRDLHTTLLMHHALNNTTTTTTTTTIRDLMTTAEDATSLAWMLERNVQLVQQRINSLQTQQQQQHNNNNIASSSPPPPPPRVAEPVAVKTDGGGSTSVVSASEEEEEEEKNLHPLLEYDQAPHQKKQNWFIDSSSSWQPWNPLYRPTNWNGVVFGGEEMVMLQPPYQQLLDYDGSSACHPNNLTFFPFN